MTRRKNYDHKIERKKKYDNEREYFSFHDRFGPLKTQVFQWVVTSVKYIGGKEILLSRQLLLNASKR